MANDRTECTDCQCILEEEEFKMVQEDYCEELSYRLNDFDLG